MQGWTIIHYNHNEVALGQVEPIDLEFGQSLGDVDYCSYEINLSDPMAVYTRTQAYVTDFTLYRNDNPYMAGMHTEVEVDLDSRQLRVAGKEWLHYFERRIWPFDPANPLSYLYSRSSTDVYSIAEEIMTTILAFPNSLDLTYGNGLAGFTTNFAIEPADTEDILSKLRQLQAVNPGFDIECTPDKIVHFHTPHKLSTIGIPLAEGKNLTNVRRTDPGPQASHLLAIASTETFKVGATAYDDNVAATYRRLDASIDLGNIDTNTLTARATTEFNRMKEPALNITADVMPESADEFWNSLTIGANQRLICDTEYLQVDDYFRVESFVGRQSSESNETVEISFGTKI